MTLDEERRFAEMGVTFPPQPMGTAVFADGGGQPTPPPPPTPPSPPSPPDVGGRKPRPTPR